MTKEEALIILQAYQKMLIRDDLPISDLYYALELAIKALERSTGHWIKHNKFNNAEAYYLECSECGYITYQDNPNYCEDCGAKMDEPYRAESDKPNKKPIETLSKEDLESLMESEEEE